MNAPKRPTLKVFRGYSVAEYEFEGRKEMREEAWKEQEQRNHEELREKILRIGEP